MKYITVGILAHVDAGKTTTIESMLVNAGLLKKAGRVDHQDAFLDYDAQERNRGITIYSKEASFNYKDAQIFLIDTPGHIDFSSEMERTLGILDLAVLIINGQDGVQSHTETIWKCLESYHIPVIVFINKMDISYHSPEELLQDLEDRCSPHMAVPSADDFEEQISLCDDTLLDAYMENGSLAQEMIQEAFLQRKFFPVFFGSALKNNGVKELMDQMIQLFESPLYSSEFGARIFKITKDEQGNRLTHIKITGGSLKPKQKISETEKVDQIRLYNGPSYQLLSQAQAGMVVALKGIEHAEIGQGLGFEKDSPPPMLNAYLNYRLLLPQGVDPLEIKDILDQLANEDPSLQIEINENTHQISLRLMGDIQMEVLQKRIETLSGISVGFGLDRVLYKETIKAPVIGMGHFEPLRHYAEVHLRLEPLARGKGLQFEADLSSDDLALNWQRLILTHLKEKRHRGVLTGSPITDMKITLIAGKSHLKHTEGGDFRQATYRAVRQGLKMAESILLEPYYRFTLQVPSSRLSKALFDLESRQAEVKIEDLGNETMEISGKGPVRTLMNYQNEVMAYTRGAGRYNCVLEGYYPCVEQEKIVKEIGYDSEADLKNPTGSIFCIHGSGTYIPYDDVAEYMHIQPKSQNEHSYQRVRHTVNEEELKNVFNTLGGKNKREEKKPKKIKRKIDLNEQKVNSEPKKEECLIIDGYNMIFSWNSLRSFGNSKIDLARDALIDQISNFQGYRQIKILLVFDGWRLPHNIGSSFRQGGLDIVYTRTGQSADQYIERKVHELKGKYRITVATGDGLIQNAILANGARRMSNTELESQVLSVNKKALSHLNP
ncbi:TetM/TetW/TetO/TetS family tetracycline resistance ribosomal protection protein [Faecalicoccus acidiformans]|uniref:translation factor GTPase family protein n=1 Tax=Faecalicoccus acidiformans TaxID=915173 RepID=UPI0025A42CEE|nr:TetM/TetW/TetO/TetS family tetracycline resistance ribosomal protection protein [Faecalicoccus acidiformans]MDM8203364.1 TetM/TetW/TetO/TetS family tetracycline resistance ribosomal protection protein [Faecalicoccus acidiformans]